MKGIADEEERICLEQLHHHGNEATFPSSHPKEVV